MFYVTRDVKSFGLGENKRKYIVVTDKFSVVKKFFAADKYNALTGEGEQRELVMPHVKKLLKEIEGGTFTPTAVSVGLKPDQIAKLVWEQDNKKVSLKLLDGEVSPLTDGQHRFKAMHLLSEMDNYRDDINNCDITALVMLDGSTKKDFLNLQLGRQVDTSHLHSMSIQEKMTKHKDSKAIELAYEATKLLAKNEKSPFYNQIRFDSTGVAGIPVSTLSSKGASDIATSLVGGAKIALRYSKDAQWLVNCILTAFSYVKAQAPHLFEVGMPLCPPPNGTKGSATMIIGLGNILAYRLAEEELTETIIGKLVQAAKNAFGTKVDGNFSGPMKRSTMGTYASILLNGTVPTEKCWHSLPKDLLELLSCSAFAVPKIEKVKVEKPKKEKKTKPSEDEHKDIPQNLFEEPNGGDMWGEETQG